MPASPRKSVPSPEMNRRMQRLLTTPANQTCADCPAYRPRWVSFLLSSSDKEERIMGVFCCSQCAQYHWYELGKKRCMIKYLKMAHEWTMEDIEILESSGNDYVNSMLEPNLTSEDFDKALVLKDEEKESTRRSKFIKNKYKRHRYSDDIMFHQMMIDLLKKKKKAQKKKAEPKHEEWWESSEGSSERENVCRVAPAPTSEEPETGPRFKPRRRDSIRNFAAQVEAHRRNANDNDDMSRSMKDESLQLDTLQSSSSGRGDRPPQRARRFNSRNVEACLEGSDSSIKLKSRTRSDASIQSDSSGSSSGEVASRSSMSSRSRRMRNKRPSMKVVVEGASRRQSLSGANAFDRAAIAQTVKQGEDTAVEARPPQARRRRASISAKLTEDDNTAPRRALGRRRSGKNLLVTSEAAQASGAPPRGMARRRSLSNPSLFAHAGAGNSDAAPSRPNMRRRRSLSNPTLPAPRDGEKKPDYLQAIAELSNSDMSGVASEAQESKENPQTTPNRGLESHRSFSNPSLKAREPATPRQEMRRRQSTSNLALNTAAAAALLQKNAPTGGKPVAEPSAVSTLPHHGKAASEEPSPSQSPRKSRRGSLGTSARPKRDEAKSSPEGEKTTRRRGSIGAKTMPTGKDATQTVAAKSSPPKDPKQQKRSSGSKTIKKLGRSSFPTTESRIGVPTAAELGYEDPDDAAERKLKRRKEKLIKAATPPIRGNSSESLKLSSDGKSLVFADRSPKRNLSRSSSSSSLTTPAAA